MTAGNGWIAAARPDMETGVFAEYKVRIEHLINYLRASRLEWFCINAAIENVAIRIIFTTEHIKTIAETRKCTEPRHLGAVMDKRS